MQISFAGSSKGLNGEYLALFHLHSAVVFGDGDLFVAVDVVPEDIMAGEASDGFHRLGFPADFNLVAFHCFLDRGADVTHPCVDAGVLSINQLLWILNSG